LRIAFVSAFSFPKRGDLIFDERSLHLHEDDDLVTSEGKKKLEKLHDTKNHVNALPKMNDPICSISRS